jgi:hypothetical protein
MGVTLRWAPATGTLTPAAVIARAARRLSLIGEVTRSMLGSLSLSRSEVYGRCARIVLRNRRGMLRQPS